MSPPAEVTPATLAEHPLPDHDADATKHDRGTVCVVGGSCETPGAVLLGGIAALRAGAGRLRIATAEPCSTALAVALPEARVLGIGVLGGGCLDPAEVDLVTDLAGANATVLLGPGMLDADAAEPFVDAVTAGCPDAVVVFDAGALPAVGRHPEWVRRLDGRALLLPNASELQALGVDHAEAAAERFGAVVGVRGAETTIATPDGRCFLDHHGTVGLATSGSGDVATGIAAGLLARGADPLAAALWAAAAHGLAGERLGGIGFLARELLDEVPGVLLALSAPGGSERD